MRASVDTALHLIGRVALVDGAKGDVVEDGGGEELVIGILEDEADGGADGAQVLLVDGQPTGVDLTSLRQQQAVEVEKQGGLAGTVGADQGDFLAGLDLEGDVREGLAAIRVVVAKTGDLYGVMVHVATPLATDFLVDG